MTTPTPHVDFCHTMNAELMLGLSLPDRDDLSACRRIAAAPMLEFFRQAGFPETSLQTCVEAYESRFALECPVAMFDGVNEMITDLCDAGVTCAVVSSNTAENVRAGLGEAVSSRFAFIDGINNAPSDKAESIAAALVKLGIAATEAVYVGDTIKDYVKATEVGVPFVGVDYGFEALATKHASDELPGASVALSVTHLLARLRRIAVADSG